MSRDIDAQMIRLGNDPIYYIDKENPVEVELLRMIDDLKREIDLDENMLMALHED